MFSPSLIKKSASFSKEFGSLEKLGVKEIELCSDSRKYQKGQLFWAIKGPHFDGFKFAEQVVQAGGEIIVFEESPENLLSAQSLLEKYPGTCLLSVQDSVKALQEVAVSRLNEWRQLDERKLVMGITGSNGKTTHKEMLWGILNEVFPGKVYCTEGNLNNHLGVPFTLLSLKNSHQIAIVEMGTNHPGEIPFLCDLAEPDTGLITNIGESHLEFFKTKDNVFLEKRVLFDKVAARDRGPFVVNKEDPFLQSLGSYDKLHFFSDREEAQTKYQLKGETLSFSFQGQEIEITNKNLFGDYNFKNLLACYLLAALNFPEKIKELAEAASHLALPSNNRCTFVEKKGKEIFLDAYNANPSSMKVALEAYTKRMKDLDQNPDETFFIVGDMNELGDLADESHQELGNWLKNMGHPQVIFIGRYGEYFQKTHNTPWVFKDVEDFRNNLPPAFNDAGFLFIKASRSLQLETIVDIV